MERYREILLDIKGDRSSGAGLITQKTIACLDALLDEVKSGTGPELISSIHATAADILKEQPGMAQLVNLFNIVFVTIEEKANEDPVCRRRRIRGVLRRFKECSRNAVAQIASLGAQLIVDDCVVLLHSNSSTILEIVKKAHADGRTFQVILAESRPIGEGRACAQELSGLGIPTTYFVDAAISKGLVRSDLVLLGADSLSEKTLINKVGTQAICLLAREAIVPCYAACESTKFISSRLSPKKEMPRAPSEVWDSPPTDVTVENYYFDEVGLDLFSGILTEDGIATASEIAQQVCSQRLSTRLLEIVK